MNFASFAECTSTLPSDHHVEDDEVITFGGRRAAEALGDMLRGFGYRVEGPMEVGEHGWDLDVFVDGKRIWMEVQGDSDEFWLRTEAMIGVFGRLLRPDLSHYREFMRRLSLGLRDDPRFTETKWFALEKNRPVGQPLDEPPSMR